MQGIVEEECRGALNVETAYPVALEVPRTAATPLVSPDIFCRAREYAIVTGRLAFGRRSCQTMKKFSNFLHYRYSKAVCNLLQVYVFVLILN